MISCRVGDASRRTASAPVTCGAAIDVPSLNPYVSSTIDDSMSLPGAKTSSSGPRLLKLETVSSSSVEPTVNAVEMQPGAPTALRKPLLPAEMTVATPAASRASMAVLRAA